MRLRAGIGMVAATAVWHGALLVRHSVVVADALRHHRALLTDVMSLCRTRPGKASHAVLDLPPVPLPPTPRPDHGADSPVCAGLMGAVLAALPPQILPSAAAPAVSSAEAEALRVPPSQVAHPPASGPPRGPPRGPLLGPPLGRPLGGLIVAQEGCAWAPQG